MGFRRRQGPAEQGTRVLTELVTACEQVRGVQLHVAYLGQQVHMAHLHVVITVDGHQITTHTPRAYHVP
jgi:hypothetical protein